MFTKDMWKRIKWLQEKLENKYPEDLRLLHLITCTQLNKEISEVLDCIPWKFEREMEVVEREELLEELVDVFRFYCRLLYIHDVTEEEFKKAFNKKSEIVERRLLNGTDMEKHLSKKI